MSENKTCGRCGAALSAETTGGLCPRCLMAVNFESRTISEGERSPLSPEEMRERFPQFEILECLGRGGMGVVYKARQKALDRVVAIKVLAGEWQGDPGFARRFEREAKTLAQMSHPNIVTVHDFGEAGGLYYLVMEHVDGVNLRELLREGKMAPEQALAIVPPVCEALEYAHGKGVVHRDIKPENLLLDREGRVKIADFGIASLVGAGGEKSGTPPYMAPEQETGGVDRRADIYALGVVLYEMLTGERPTKDVVAPSRKVELDVRIDEMVLRALEKEPERRYQTAGEFRTVVETLSHPGAKVLEKTARRKNEPHPAASWALGLLVAALLGTPLLFALVPGGRHDWVLAFGVLCAVGSFVAGLVSWGTKTGRWVATGWLGLIGVAGLMAVFYMSLSSGAAHAARMNVEGAQDEAFEALTNEAWQLWRSGRLEEANEMFEEAVKLRPEDPDAWNGLGWARFNSGDAEGGETAFEKVLELDPDHPAALNGIGQIALSKRDDGKAERYLLKAADRNATAAWFGLARLYLVQGKFGEAEKWAEKLEDSGDAGETLKMMLDAARVGMVPDELRRMIDPSPQSPAGSDPSDEEAATQRAVFEIEKPADGVDGNLEALFRGYFDSGQVEHDLFRHSGREPVDLKMTVDRLPASGRFAVELTCHGEDVARDLMASIEPVLNAWGEEFGVLFRRVDEQPPR